jgi:hypothetical protein
MIFVYSFKYYIIPRLKIRVRVMAFNTTFNNISDMSWQSVLLVEEYLEKTTDLLQVSGLLRVPWFLHH